MISPGLTTLTGGRDPKSPATLRIDVIADLACPWCYLGKRRLDDALASVHGPSIVTWYPFQLNPSMPESGMPLEEYLASKYGDPESLQPAIAELVTAGREEGINFRFDRVTTVPNTMDAHRIMKLAETEGINTSDLAELILRGFFEQGLDIADRDVLIEFGQRQGLEAPDVHKTLDDDLSRRVVLSQEAHVRQSGVTGVPDFLINKRLFAIGAQSTGNLVALFDRVMFGEESDLPVSATVH